MVSQERVRVKNLMCDELHEFPIRQQRDEYFGQGDRWSLEEALASLEQATATKIVRRREPNVAFRSRESSVFVADPPGFRTKNEQRYFCGAKGDYAFGIMR